MPKRIDLSTRTFGRLTVLHPLASRSPAGCRMYRCRCECGTLCDRDHNTLVTGRVKSCGCLRRVVSMVELARELVYLMRDVGPVSLRDIRDATGWSWPRARAVVACMHERRFLHIGAWVRAGQPVWALGSGEDAVEPARLTGAQRVARCREKKRVGKKVDTGGA